METIAILKNKVDKFIVALLMIFIPVILSAQENTEPAVNEKVTSTKTTTTTEWYADPLYLVIGAIVLIIIIALLVGRGRK